MRIHFTFGLVFLMMAVIAGCMGGYIDQRLEDGYDLGDISMGAKEDIEHYCQAEFDNLRRAGRFAAGMAGVQIPDTCEMIWRRLFNEMRAQEPSPRIQD